MDPTQTQDPANSTAPINGKPDDNSNGNQGEGDENIRALQQKLTEKDKELKGFQSQLEQFKKEKEDLEKKKEKIKEESKTENQKLLDRLKNLEKLQAQRDLQTNFEKVKEKFPKFSESIIKLLIKDKKGNLEEVEEALSKQAESLGYSEIETPKFSQVTAQQEIDKLNKDTSLSTEEVFAKIKDIKQNTESS